MHKYLCIYLLLVWIKGKVVLLLDRLVMFHNKRDQSSLTVKIFTFTFTTSCFVHFSNKLSLMCPRLWPKEDICIGLYVLKRLLNVRHILENVMSMQQSFEEFSEKHRRVELKYVGNFVAKTVLVESANQFSLEELCWTKYNLKYFSKSYRPSDRLEKPTLLRGLFKEAQKILVKLFQTWLRLFKKRRCCQCKIEVSSIFDAWWNAVGISWILRFKRKYVVH